MRNLSLTMEEKFDSQNFDISLVSNKQLSFKKGAYIFIASAVISCTSLLGLDAYLFPKERKYDESKIISAVNQDFVNYGTFRGSDFLDNVRDLQNIVETGYYFNLISNGNLKNEKLRDIEGLTDKTTKMVCYLPVKSQRNSIEDLILDNMKNPAIIADVVKDINQIGDMDGSVYYSFVGIGGKGYDEIKGEFLDNNQLDFFKQVYFSKDFNRDSVKGIMVLDNFDDESKSYILQNYNSVAQSIQNNLGISIDVKFGSDLKNLTNKDDDMVDKYTYFGKFYEKK
jgi:hypothetical protein